LERLAKIRELAAIFRLKYGREIKNISRSSKWRDELDHTGAFKELRNRQLEIFKPLAILCMKYKPEWTDLTSKYIHKFAEMREKTGSSPEATVLYALRKLWELVDDEHRHGRSFFTDDEQEVCFEDNEADGQVMYVSAKLIGYVIENHGIGTIEEFGRTAASQHSHIGRIFSEFGFVGTRRERGGNFRMIKTTKLADRCLTYLGIRLSQDYELSQQEIMDLLAKTLRNEREIEYDALKELVIGKMTEDQLLSCLKKMRTRGEITTTSSNGKGMITWMK